MSREHAQVRLQADDTVLEPEAHQPAGLQDIAQVRKGPKPTNCNATVYMTKLTHDFATDSCQIIFSYT